MVKDHLNTEVFKLNMRKTVKKIAALVAGTTMVGATIMGAMALDLSNYPAPFVTNGVFSGKIVVGATAATSDVAGAIDLAASLQAAATSTTEVELPDTAGKATVTGDAAEFKTGSDILSLNGELLSAVKKTFTADDLNALKSGVLDTGLGSTPVKQYLKFDNTEAWVLYGPDNDDNLGDFLFFDDTNDAPFFEYHMEFTEGAISELGDDNALDDYEGEVINMLGAPFTIVMAKRLSGNGIQLDMLGGQVADTLRDGETKTYTIDGKDYEVTAVFIDSADPNKAKLSVNGMLTKELEEGSTQVLGSDVTVGVQEIMTNQREGIVEFYLGANKLSLKDTDYTDAAFNGDGTVKAGSKTLNDVDVIIKATNNTANDELTISYIKYEALPDDSYYVAPGKGLKELVTYPEIFLTGTWDIKYAGLMKTGTTPIKFSPVSDHSYKLEFENLNGDAYSVPLASTKDGDFVWGQEAGKHRLIFTEYANGTDPQHNASTFISQKDYFVISDTATDATVVDNAVTNVMRYASIQTGTKIVNFEDLAGGTLSVSYAGTEGNDAEGELIVGGQSHAFYVGGDSTNDNETYALSMDLDGANDITNGTIVYIVTKGGGIFGSLAKQKFAVNTGQALPIGTGNTATFNFTITASKFDEAAYGPEAAQVTLAEDLADPEVLVVDLAAPALETDDANDKYQKAMNIYGTYFELFTPDTGSPTLKIEYPLTQRGAQAFVTAGVVEVKEGSASAGGVISSTTLHPIGVGLAIMDTDAMSLLGTQKLIVVGGPCVNTVAASLMGNPADCTTGFTAGKAIIKLYADKNALLVAGYGAQDTVGACYVLGEYKKYNLPAKAEAEVVVADLSSITVNAVQ